MIKHHPTLELLHSFASGDLSIALSTAISIHVDMCPQCQKTVAEHTHLLSQLCFKDAEYDDTHSQSDELNDTDFEDMIAQITDNSNQVTIDATAKPTSQYINYMQQTYELPRALNQVKLGSWRNIGKLSRSKLAIEDDKIHSHLLSIAAQGEIPQHTHKGFELTLLLEGQFEDEFGQYKKGDFIMLDHQHKHQPKTQKGCLCLTVVSDALEFTQGLPKLLNPIGGLLY